MKTHLAILALSVALLSAAVAPALAHHSFGAEFDREAEFVFTGVVTKIEWLNPHVYFYMDVQDDAGEYTNWAMEMGSPNGLMRRGWNRNTLMVGDEVTVDGSKARDGSDKGNAASVTLAESGRSLLTGQNTDN